MSSAQSFVIAACAVVSAVLLGWGLLLSRLSGYPPRNVDDLLQSFWLGWATVLVALQFWHFILPIDVRAQAAIAAVGLFGLVTSGGCPWRQLARRALPAAPLLVTLAVAVLWLSNRSLGGSRFGDTGGYYIPTIRWVIEYPVVVGVGNLYAPFAYNQSYFLYAALLEFGPFTRRPSHLVNTVLLLPLIARSLLGLWRVLRVGASPALADVFHALFLPALVSLGTGFLLTSSAPDFAVFTTGVVLTGELFALATDSVQRARLHFLAVVVFATVGITVKLSFGGLAASAMLVGAWLWLRRMWPQWRAAAGGLVVAGSIALSIIGPWVASNILMSGYPLFPLMLGGLPVEWRVAVNVQQWIENAMYIGDLRLAFANPRWLLQRFEVLGWTASDVLVPLAFVGAAAVVGMLRGAIRLLARRRLSEAGLPWLLIVPPIASLIACMIYTPVPRYAGATMWVLGITAVMLAIGGWLQAPHGRRLAAATTLALTVLPFVNGTPVLLPLTNFEANGAPVWYTIRLASGLELQTLRQGYYSCWDAPLPCTPYPHLGLRLRRPPDLGSGFVADPSILGPPQDVPITPH
jgi:hypothetical protein